MNPLDRRIITLDPGHGEISPAGNDPGAVNKKLMLTERDIVRKQADMISDILTPLGATVRILENNTTKSLTQLGREAAGSNLFVSLHLNAFNGIAQGHEVVIHTKATETDAAFGTVMSNALGEHLKINNRGVKRMNLGVLLDVPLHIPAILVESFFIDAVANKKELVNLLTASSKAIAAGIQTFLTHR